MDGDFEYGGESSNIFTFQKDLLTLGDKNSALNYQKWVGTIRSNFLEKREDFGAVSEFEFSRKLLIFLKWKTSANIIEYVTSESLGALKDCEENANIYIDLLIEQIDLNRNGRISAKEFHDFLFPLPNVRELGLLIKTVREALLTEINKISTKPLNSDCSHEDLFNAVLRMAKKRKIFLSPYIGKKFHTVAFSELVKSMDILNSDELNLIVHTIDVNVDAMISCEELKKWLFPPISPDYLGQLSVQAIGVTQPSLDDLDNEKQGQTIEKYLSVDDETSPETPDFNALAALFRNVLLSNCENQKDRVLMAFDELDTDKDGHLSVKELEEMVNSFIEDIKLCNSEEDVASYRALIFDHLDSDGSGTIEREEFVNFLWPEDAAEPASPSEKRPFAVAQQAARVKILAKMGLSPATSPSSDSSSLTADSSLKEEDGHVESKLPSIDDVSDFTLNDKFNNFLKSFPVNKEFLCRRRHIFVSQAIQRALVYLPMPEFGGSQQLTRKEVSTTLLYSLDSYFTYIVFLIVCVALS